MELKTINLQLTKNIGNYESVKIGGEWSVTADEDVILVTKKANELLNALFEQVIQKPTPNPQALQPLASDGTQKKVLEFGSPTLQAVCDRIAAGTADIETIEKWFCFDAKVRNVLELAKTIA